MAALGMREAAQQVGLHRSSLFRAIRSGRLSATRTESGDFLIEPVELFRVYPPKTTGNGNGTANAQDAQVITQPRAQGDETARTNADDVRLATLEAEVRGLRELNETLRRECDRWAAQPERLALAPPRRSWSWPWRRG